MATEGHNDSEHWRKTVRHGMKLHFIKLLIYPCMELLVKS